VIENEVYLLDRAFRGGPIPKDGGRDGTQGRDVRLHVGGDVSSSFAAGRLADAAERWALRGGGLVFAFTHRWRAIARRTWGLISVLASVEGVDGAGDAIERGYVPAIVVASFGGETKPHRVRGLPRGWRALPCPAETRGTTCVECRACMSAGVLRDAKIAIAFEAHGPAAAKARRALQVVQ
jgi:hypothetical protein